MVDYLVNILIALDQLLNVLFLGSPDETLSARAWRKHKYFKQWAIARHVINALFFFQNDHCQRAYESEMMRKQLPTEYR